MHSELIKETLYEVEGFQTLKAGEISSSGFRVLEIIEDKMKVVLGNKVYHAIIKKRDFESKEFVINVSGIDFKIKMKESIDQLVDELGFLKAAKHSVKEIKSPMPGLVVNIFVEIGQNIEEGDTLLSLEAMKMENILKSSGDGVVKSIHIVKGQAVEKKSIVN